MKRLLAVILLMCLMLPCAACAEEYPGQVIPVPVDDAAPELPEAALEGAPDAGTYVVEAPEAESGDPAETTGQAESEPEEPVPVEISIKKSASQKVWLGEMYQVKVPGKKISDCKSASKKIATVTKGGLITPKKPGKVKITVTLSNKKKLTLTLNVADPTVPASVAIDEGDKRTVAVGDAFQLNAVVSPQTAPQAVSWSSSKEAVAAVDAEGLVTPLKPGRAVITAATANKKQATFVVNVRKEVVQPYMISHAMGGLDGKDYTNCLEAFYQKYEEGFRVFEVDFEMTSDNRMVLCHDWKRALSSSLEKGVVPTFKQFMSAKIYDKYTPMSLEDLLLLMNDYPDVRIITDIKSFDAKVMKKQYRQLVDTTLKMGMEDILDRFIVEVYDEDTFKAVDKIHHFTDYIFTLYKLYKKAPTKSQLKSVCSFCRKNGIRMVSMYAKWWKADYEALLSAYGLESSVHHVDKRSAAKKFFDQGVTAVYTNFLPPEI